MDDLTLHHLALRYCRQIVMDTMDHVRSRMREEDLPALRRQVGNVHIQESELNPTTAIDQEAEELILSQLNRKFAKLPGVKAYTIFSEELGIQTSPEGAREADANLVVFIDPIDGTELAEALQGGWSLIAVYDRHKNDVIAAFRKDAKHPKRTPFVAAKNPALVEQAIRLGSRLVVAIVVSPLFIVITITLSRDIWR